MKSLRHFRVRTILNSVLVILVLPGIAYGILLYWFKPDLLSSVTWVISEFVFWAGVLILIPKLWGSNYREWLHFDTLKILKAFEQYTYRTLDGIVDKLPTVNQRIDREEFIEAYNKLQAEKCILITGESGSGKSGIAASLAKNAIQRGIPVLFLDTRQYSKTVNDMADLSYFINVEGNIKTCMEKVAKQVGSFLLIVDQLDSTLGTPASQVSIDLLANAKLHKNSQVVAVSYISKSSEYKPVLDLGFAEVSSKALDEQITIRILQNAGINKPSDVLLSIANNLFYLSILLEIVKSVDIPTVSGDIQLLEEYLLELEKTEGGHFIQIALKIAYDKLVAGQLIFSLPRVKDKPTHRLIQRGVILDLGRNQYRFRHEQLHFFLFSKQIAEHKIPLSTILDEFETQKVDTPIIFVLKYLHASKHAMMKEFLDVVFSKTNRLQFYDKAGIIDEMISWGEVESCMTYLSSFWRLIRKEPPYSNYFFKHLAESRNPAWFPVLKRQNFFLPSLKEVEDEGPIQSPYWPALAYLAAIALELPSEVLEVAENFRIENASGMSVLVKAFTKIPATFAPRIAPIITDWLDKKLPVSDEIITLIKYWSTNKQWEQSLTIIDAILTPQVLPVSEELRQSEYYSPRARFRDFNFAVEKFVEGITNLPEAPWTEILVVLEKKVIQALKIEEKKKQYEYTSYWRPSIEPSSQYFGDRCKDLLVDSIVRIIDRLTPKQLSEIANKYINHRLSIFRRLAIHVVRTNESLWPQYLDNLYADPKYWEDVEYYHEYWLLTRDTFSVLSPAKQQTYLERILTELDSGTNDDDKRYSRHWVYRRLWAIKSHLPPHARNIFAELREEFNDPNPPEWFAFLAYSSDLKEATRLSSKTSKELLEMSLSEVLSELKKEYPLGRRTSLDEPTIEGLAIELQAAIKENPAHFAPIAAKLMDEKIHPWYVGYSIYGFREAWKEKRDFDWNPVLELSLAVSKTSEDVGQGGTPADMLPNYWDSTYGEARKTTVDLLNSAIANDEHAIPYEYLDKVRDVLLQLCDDLNPSPEYEAKWSGQESWSYLNSSLNVTRAKAVAALIDYALHRSRIAKNDESAKSLLPKDLRIEPEVREKLTEKLDRNSETSKAVHVNFGLYLPNLNYLDKEWLLVHLEEIFPRNSELIEYWQAAWEGYTWRNTFYISLYSDLKPYYHYAVEKLVNSNEKEIQNPEKRLAEHLAFLYVNGVEPLDGKDSLVSKFLEIAPDKLRAEFIETLSPSRIPPALDAQSDEWQAIKLFWLQRYEYISNQKDLNNFKEELIAYLLWVPHIPEPLEAFEKMLEASIAVADGWQLTRLFEHLAKTVSDHPALVMNLLEKSLQRTDLPYALFALSDEIQNILETAMHSGEKGTRESAVRVINLYGERGEERYRDLLNEV